MLSYDIVLRPLPPFRFTDHLDRFALEARPTPMLWFKRERRLLLTVRVDEKLVPVEAEFSGEPWDPLVRLRIHTTSAHDADYAKVVFAQIVRADFDYVSFMETLKRINAKLYTLAARYAGLRPGRCMSLYAALIDSVVKQRIMLPLALKIYSKLVQRYGARIEAGGEVFYWHPLPEKLTEASVDDLGKHGLTRLKARAVKEIAQAKLENRLPSVDEVVADPYTAFRELIGLYGVGPWTAQLAIAMVHPDFPLGPITDLAVVHGLSYILGLSQDKAQIMAKTILERLPGYSGLILYLAAYDYESRRKRNNTARSRETRRSRTK